MPAELVETVPDSLKERIAFIHGGVRTHEDGPGRPSTEAHKAPRRSFREGVQARGDRP